ncbi:AraC family transcriptional regulator [Tatumella morbirosei]|uniref:AraC family transcriptional regulator n=1 Tax=Tatumella morbirosei TaxID=642227 RepID=A0A095TTY0_9GAMM|nr:helix-turn-helix transcriptional regulator [Tatumella morbirosei]KGD80261.1 AraC family transcriptional regulator [Tatumella morbirosei]
MNSLSSDTDERLFRIADFREFGHRYAIDYRFPAGDEDQSIDVVRGQVEEWRLASGMSVTHSDLQILQPYESTSVGSSPLYLLVVLDGHVDLRLNGKPVRMSPGTAMSTRLGRQSILSASHQKDQRLVTVSLGMNSAQCQAPSPLAALTESWQRTRAPVAVWNLPEYMQVSMRFAISRQATAVARELMLEGLMLQLLGLTLNQLSEPEGARFLTLPGDHHRLEAVRQLLESSPEKNHSLESLAKTAAMSSSSLRTKFRQAYGDSVFNYLRDCRLALARRYLQQGYSVQQAAWMSGYQHATNFATAFRRRYGVSPSHLTSQLALRA